MFKYLIAAVVAFTPTAASAQIMITEGRQAVLQEAAKTICRNVMESKQSSGAAFDREVSYLRLNRDETSYMLSLCILYAQGMLDGMKAVRR